MQGSQTPTSSRCRGKYITHAQEGKILGRGSDCRAGMCCRTGAQELAPLAISGLVAQRMREGNLDDVVVCGSDEEDEEAASAPDDGSDEYDVDVSAAGTTD